MIHKIVLILLLIAFAGCEKPSNRNADKQDPSKNESTQAVKKEVNKLKGHESDSHRHGPNGGHIFEFDNNANFLGEWKQHRSSDLVTIFVLDSAGKKNLPSAVQSMIVRRGDAMFSLDPVQPDDDGKTARYSLEDKDLTIAMNLGVTVEIEIGDKVYAGTVANTGHHH